MYLSMALADPAVPADLCGVSGVLRQPLGVTPDEAVNYLNHSVEARLVAHDLT